MTTVNERQAVRKILAKRENIRVQRDKESDRQEQPGKEGELSEQVHTLFAPEHLQTDFTTHTHILKYVTRVVDMLLETFTPLCNRR